MLITRNLKRRKFSGKALPLSAVFLLFALHNGDAAAHDFWIEPENFQAAAGATVPLRLFVGQDFKGEPVLYAPDLFERYIFVGPNGEQPVRGTLGDDPAGAVTATRAGLYTVGYQSSKFDLTFDSLEKLEEYLKMEGLERHLPAARQRFKVRNGALEIYSRYAKALMRVNGGGGEFAHVLGFPLELIAQTNPYGGESRLRVQLLYRGKPLEGALVIASNKRDPTNKQRIRTDKDGRATVAVDKPGVWLVNAVHMIPAGLLAKADWESFWASLTFERR